MPPVPPWAVGNTPEPVSLDIDGFVDVSAYVRLEDRCPDIHYGVLDIQVNFHHEGNLMNVYMLHFFALAENYPRCAAVVQGWKDGFTFPPALTRCGSCFVIGGSMSARSSVWLSMTGA